jgi:toxin-antitoxin system PIN domain toxin
LTFLLDVNVLIALIDGAHVHHEPAHRWFASEGGKSWATCPITESAVLRIVGSPRYPMSPGSPAAVVPSLKGMRSHPGHVFWPDEISLLDGAFVDPTRLLAASQITDTYLLALAASRGGQLATFDRRLLTLAVARGAEHLRVIE